MSRPISAKVSDDLYDRLSLAAERNDRSKSWITEQALQNFLDEDEARHQQILNGLADVEAGRTVPQADVRAWAGQLLTAARAKPQG